MLERDIVKDIKDYIKAKGGRVIRYHGSAHSEAGVPDLLICYRGLFVFMEVKRPGKERTPKQVQVCNELVDNQAIGSVVRSVEDARHILEYADIKLQRFK